MLQYLCGSKPHTQQRSRYQAKSQGLMHNYFIAAADDHLSAVLNLNFAAVAYRGLDGRQKGGT
jgi:hypothetical protein